MEFLNGYEFGIRVFHFELLKEWVFSNDTQW